MCSLTNATYFWWIRILTTTTLSNTRYLTSFRMPEVCCQDSNSYSWFSLVFSLGNRSSCTFLNPFTVSNLRTADSAAAQKTQSVRNLKKDLGVIWTSPGCSSQSEISRQSSKEILLKIRIYHSPLLKATRTLHIFRRKEAMRNQKSMKLCLPQNQIKHPRKHLEKRHCIVVLSQI